jgi:hypothetical protein
MAPESNRRRSTARGNRDFVRSDKELPRAQKSVQAAKLDSKLLDENMQTETGRVSLGTMHAAKGLEFRGIAVMACDDDVIPSQERIEALTDDADLEEVTTLSGICSTSPARGHAIICWSPPRPGFEFLDDLKR